MIFIGVALLIAGVLALVISTDAGQAFGLEQPETAQLVGLLMILILVAGGAFGRRYPLSQMLANIIIWVCLFGVALVGYTYRYEVQSVAMRVMGELSPGEPQTSANGNSVRIMRGLSGAFSVNVQVNDTQVPMIFDTGASAVVISFKDARAIGVNVDALRFTVPVKTANGTGKAAQIRLREVRIGGIIRQNIRGFVAEDGALETSLLGMSFLETLSSYAVNKEALELTD